MATYGSLAEAQKAMTGKSYSYRVDPKTNQVSVTEPYNEIRKQAAADKTGVTGAAAYAKALMSQGYSSDDAIKRAYSTTGTSAEKAVDPYAEIKAQQAALLKAQKQARIDALSGQRQSALSALGAEESTVAPQYLQQRATLKTSGEQAARRAQEALAARGLGASGASAQGDIARNVALQQGMTSIGEAEAGTLANIAQRKTQAEQAYASGVAQAESEAAATAAQAEIQRLMQAQQAQEATAASAAEREWEMQKVEQAQANAKMIKELEIAAQTARDENDYTRARELNKQKSDLEKEQITLKASYDKSGGGGTKTPKVTEGQLNTLMNNYNTMVQGNPYYKSGGRIYQEKRMGEYISALAAKVQAGAIDPTTAAQMIQHVQLSPEYKAIYGTETIF